MLAALLAVLLVGVVPARGGSCWTGVSRSGRCSDLVRERVSKEECCSAASSAGSSSAAWSPEDLDAGSLFYWRVLGGGVKCTPCRDSCAGVTCGAGRRCVLRWGRPQCACAPDCARQARQARQARHAPRGPVCGTDGRSYRSACRLAKRACRKKSSTLTIAYHGLCQSSCQGVRCGAGRSCVLDQTLSPHCVRCARRCPARVAATRAVCGADGLTYESACHLRDAACRKGKAIPVAYRGRCHKAASCGASLCRPRQSCLSDLSTGAARCVTCAYRSSCAARPRLRARHGSGATSAARGLRRGASATGSLAAVVRGNLSPADRLDNEPISDFGGPVCGSNNRTYLSWCHMLRDACATGYVIDTQHSGPCAHRGQPESSLSSPITNTVLDENSFA